MQYEILIGCGAAAIVIVLLILIGYVKAPPDTAYMISGFRKPRILIGKAGIRIPFLERLDKLSLKMFSVDVKTTDYVPNAAREISQTICNKRMFFHQGFCKIGYNFKIGYRHITHKCPKHHLA